MLGLILGLAISSGAPQTPQAAPPTLAEIDKLVALYKELKLPIPASDAPLVVTGHVTVGNQHGTKELVSIGYLVKKVPKGGMVLHGTILKFEEEDLKPFKATSSNAELVHPHCSQDLWGQESGLAVVVIERTRGNDAFALALAKKLVTDDDERPNSSSQSLKERMLDLATSHWVNSLVDSSVDHELILENLVALGKRDPSLHSEFLKEIVSGLRETVRNRYTGSNENEKLIDLLCDSKVNGHFGGFMGPGSNVDGVAALRNLAAAGFEAMPHLIDHFGDKRLTRGIVQGFNNFGSSVMTVGEACLGLAIQLCPEKIEGWGDDRKEVVKKWWTQASSKPDRENGLAALLKDDFAPPVGAVIWASKRSPDLLLEAYNKIVGESRKSQTYGLLEAMKPVMEPEKFIKAAVRGCASNNLHHVHSAIWALHKTDKREFDRQLVTVLDRLPTTISDDQVIWLSREPSFAQQVAYSESPEVWAALTRATIRADVNLRLQLLDHSSKGRLTQPSRKALFKYLLEFFDDTTRCEPGGPKRGRMEREAYEDHGFLMSRRVQDLAVALAAQELDMEDIPDENAKRSVWDAYRQTVTARVKAEFAKQ